MSHSQDDAHSFKSLRVKEYRTALVFHLLNTLKDKRSTFSGF